MAFITVPRDVVFVSQDDVTIIETLNGRIGGQSRGGVLCKPIPNYDPEIQDQNYQAQLYVEELRVVVAQKEVDAAYKAVNNAVDNAVDNADEATMAVLENKKKQALATRDAAKAIIDAMRDGCNA